MMRIRLGILLAATAFLLSLAPLSAHAAPSRVLELAPNVTVTLPEVEPFRSIDDIPLLRDYAVHFTPTINLYLAGYIGEEDMAQWRSGKPEEWSKWAFIQSFRSTIGQELDASQLEALLGELKAVALDPAKVKEIASFMDEDMKENRALISKKLNEEFTRLETSNVITGVEKLDGGIVRFSMLATVEREGGETNTGEAATAQKSICCGGAAFLLKGRMTYVYVYSNLTSKKDVEWADAKAVEWAKAILEANR